MSDIQGFMALAIFGLIGWVWGAFKPKSRWWARVGCLPAVAWILFYLWQLFEKAEAALWSGRAEISEYTAAIIGFGVWAMLVGPKQPKGQPGGGARPA